MRTLITLFLLAGTIVPAFSQVSIVVTHDTVPGTKYKPFTKVPADAFLKKLPKGIVPGFKYPPAHPNEKKRDSIMSFLNGLAKKQPPVDHMPNAMMAQPFPSANSVYKGNNGEGFDIYGSGVDHMPVLMPDSVNAGMLRLSEIFRKPKG